MKLISGTVVDLQQIIIKKNNSALELSKDISFELRKILKSDFLCNIDVFAYSRIFDNGERVYICTNAQCIDSYFTSNYQDDFELLENYIIPTKSVSVSLWSESNLDRNLLVAHKKFYWNGISIYEQ